MPFRSREVRLASRPKELPDLSNFEVVQVELPDPSPGEVVVRNTAFRVAASIRMMISEGAEDVEGVPFPALHVGDALSEEALGEVVAVGPDTTLRIGATVKHPFGWRDVALVRAARCRAIGSPLPDPAIILGHGWTAYAALTRGVHLGGGETVFVTAATGAIGSMAGQIARLLGAGRVIGSTGSRSKGQRLVDELGFDAFVCRDGGSIHAQLGEAAPGGIDVTIDLVGGDQLAAAVARSSKGACVLIMGALSGQLAHEGTGRSAPVSLDSFDLLLKKMTLRGYSADDDLDAEAEWEEQAIDWARDGRISFPAQYISGVDKAPAALVGLVAGSYFGTVLIKP